MVGESLVNVKEKEASPTLENKVEWRLEAWKWLLGLFEVQGKGRLRSTGF